MDRETESGAGELDSLDRLLPRLLPAWGDIVNRMRGQMWFILDDAGDPIPCRSIDQWAAWTQEHRSECRIGYAEIAEMGVTVCTEFIGVNVNIRGDEPPVLYETQVCIGGVLAGFAKYSTREAAEAGHRSITRAAQVESSRSKHTAANSLSAIKDAIRAADASIVAGSNKRHGVASIPKPPRS
jgi:hypothetical protein